MKKRTTLMAFFAMTFALTPFSTSANTKLTGAGATFPAPIYAKWADTYHKETGNQVNYQGIGSSGGVNQINAKTVDFGATDAPLSDEKLKDDGLFQFPTVIGGVVLAVNLEGIQSGDLTLNGQVLGDIYLGKIKKWNDPAIAALNPNLTLPNQAIAVIRRADGSGTSFVFTSYLAKVNEAWAKDVGAGSTVNWPIGMGGKGNDGVAAFVQRVKGSIGYVEYAYAKQNHLTYTKMVSADGEALLPTAQSFSDSAKSVDWSASFAQDLTNRHGENAWPIASTTFILVQSTQTDAEKGKAVLAFFNWAYELGGSQAEALDYATLPTEVISAVQAAWKTQIKDSQGQPLF